MHQLQIRSDSLELSLTSEENGLSTVLVNAKDRTIVCAKGRQRFLIRLLTAVSEPILLNRTVSLSRIGDQLEWLVGDETGAYSAVLKIFPAGKNIHYQIRISSPQPVWLFEWCLNGYDIDNVIIPALGGQSVSSDMPAGTVLSYKYPFWLNAQFIIGQKENSVIMIGSRDAGTAFKLVRISREKDGFALTYGFEAKAPLHDTTFTAEWYICGFDNGWREAVDDYRVWMEKAFGLEPFEQRPYCPVWTRDINFILEIWGAKRDSDTPNHTFDQMIDRIETWKDLHAPEQTLLYLPGFAEKGIDSHAPDYNPSPQCGGAVNFERLINRAHEIGFRIMIHTNVLAMTYTHPKFESFRRFQVVDVFGRPQSWGVDMDGDWLAEPYFAYINPGFVEWGDLMSGILEYLIDTYKLDAVFLDQTLLAFNVSTGPDFISGMREHIRRLQNKFPQVLFAGEGLHEQVAGCLPVAQIHGIDSIKEIHGLNEMAGWRQVHPVSSYLFRRYTRYVAHLLTKHPSHPLFRFQEAAYEQLGVIPALVLYDNGQEIDTPEVRDMIRRAQTLSTGIR